MSYKIFNSVFHEADIVYEFKGEAEGYYAQRASRADQDEYGKKVGNEIRDKGFGNPAKNAEDVKKRSALGRNTKNGYIYNDSTATKKSIDRHNRKSTNEFGLI